MTSSWYAHGFDVLYLLLYCEFLSDSSDLFSLLSGLIHWKKDILKIAQLRMMFWAIHLFDPKFTHI